MTRWIAACLSTLAGLSAAEPQNTVAVLDFQPSNAPQSEAVAISGFVRSAMFRTGTFVVVEKKNMDKVLTEQAFQQTGCTASDCAVKLGKVLNVRKMVVGEYTLLGGIRFLTASLVDVETGRIEAIAKEKGFEIANADEAADRLAKQLTDTPMSHEPHSGASASKPSKRAEIPQGSHIVSETPGSSDENHRARCLSFGLVSPLPGLQYEQAVGRYLALSARFGAFYRDGFSAAFMENLSLRVRPGGGTLRGFFLGLTGMIAHGGENSTDQKDLLGVGGGGEMGYAWVFPSGWSFQFGAGGGSLHLASTRSRRRPLLAADGTWDGVTYRTDEADVSDDLPFPLFVLAIGYSW